MSATPFTFTTFPCPVEAYPPSGVIALFDTAKEVDDEARVARVLVAVPMAPPANDQDVQPAAAPLTLEKTTVMMLVLLWASLVVGLCTWIFRSEPSHVSRV